MAPHSSTLDWKIPWTEEPGRLQSIGSLRVGHDWATSLSLFTVMHWRRKWQATHSSVLVWRIPGTGEPGGPLSMGSHRVGHDWSDLAAAAAKSRANDPWSAVRETVLTNALHAQSMCGLNAYLKKRGILSSRRGVHAPSRREARWRSPTRNVKRNRHNRIVHNWTRGWPIMPSIQIQPTTCFCMPSS